jgi:hypothetical protein
MADPLVSANLEKLVCDRRQNVLDQFAKPGREVFPEILPAKRNPFEAFQEWLLPDHETRPGRGQALEYHTRSNRYQISVESRTRRRISNRNRVRS